MFLFSVHNATEQPSLSATRNKIIHTFVKMLNDTDLKTQLTRLILSHIRTLSIDLDKEPGDMKLIDQLCQNFLKEKEIIMQEGNYESFILTNFLWLLHSHANKIKEAPYILEEVVDYVEDKKKYVQQKHNYFLCSRLLITTVHIFSLYPSETQHILGKIFEFCKNQNNSELDEKVVFYSKLLRCDSFYKNDNAQSASIT